MSRSFGVGALQIGVMGLALCMGGCSRPTDVLAGERTSSTGTAPFHDSSTENVDSSGVLSSNTSNKTLPFDESRHLGVGTELTVRLLKPLPVGNTPGPTTFEAVLDEPIALDGHTVLASGSEVVGRVESGRSSNLKPGRRYLRLVLDSVHTAAGDLPIQTAIVYIHQFSQSEKGGPSSALETGHRLTFRLAAPLDTPAPPVR